MPKKSTKKHDKTLKDRVVNPYKKEVFEVYKFWRSFPFMFFKMRPDTLRKDGYDVDELFERLLKCKSLRKFAEEFKVSKETLTEWEQSESIQKQIDELALNNNVLRFRKDVDRAFTKRILKYPDAPSVKLWKQLNQGFVEGFAIRTDPLKKKEAKDIFDKHA